MIYDLIFFCFGINTNIFYSINILIIIYLDIYKTKQKNYLEFALVNLLISSLIFLSLSFIFIFLLYI